jgi:hypothetical protein
LNNKTIIGDIEKVKLKEYRLPILHKPFERWRPRMMLSKAITILLLLLTTFSSQLICQNLAGTDSLVNTIRQAAATIDKDTSLTCFYSGLLSKKGNSGFLAFYVKSDSVYKVVMLDQDDTGTQMTVYYYNNSTPILILMKHNNFKLSNNIKQYPAAVLSFYDKVDTSGVINEALYKTDYQASYYVNQRKVYYSNITSSDPKMLNNIKDKDDALLLVFEAEYILGHFQSDKKSFIKF